MSVNLWEKVREEWENNLDVTYKELELKHGLKASTIRSRRSREKWERDPATVATRKKEATKKKRKEHIDKEVSKMSPTLTERQKLYCIYYLESFNATRSYMKAYGATYMASRSGANKLMRNTNVQRELSRLKQEQTTALHLDAQDVLQKYIDIAFADVTDYIEHGVETVQVDGKDVQRNYMRFRDGAQINGTIVNKVQMGRDGISIELENRMKALDMLTKYFDLLDDKTRQQLAQEKLRAEIELLKARAENGGGEGDGVVIVTGEDEMRRVLEERKRKAQEKREGDV